ncbi:MAG: UDP-N-acetylglucosamine 4-epimerase [Myxococcota bacterium]|jgi:UDP-N-acetylglucosamine 4-epimerase
MRVLVTGAAGFIGSHITRALLSDGHAVVGLDDLSTGFRHNLPAPTSGWRFIEGDVRDPAVCEAAMHGVAGVIHLAGRNSVPRSLADPRSALEVNVVGGFNLLEAARAVAVRWFVYASSSSVYGDDPSMPKVETQLRRPLSPYAASKASFEHLARAWSMSWGLPTVGLRFFNVFGPRQTPEGAYAAVVPRFVRAALTGERPIIFGDGSFSRDFTFVGNIVHAARCALEAPDEASGSVLNVACGGRVSVLDLWNAIARETGFGGSPHFQPTRAGDMPHSQADISEAHRLLGFAPVVSFDEGIRQTVAWYRIQRNGGSDDS